MVQKKTNVQIVTVTVFIATFMTAIEATILATAMPTVSGLLDGGEIVSWVFSIYLLTNAMMTPIYGKLTDSLGRKPVFQIGIFMFMLGSILCGFSGSMLQLIVFRAIQGIGAGAVMPVALTIIGDIYPPEKRAKILGYNSAAWGIASVVGPLAGGFIVETIGWHWIFFVNIPVGIILMILLQLFLFEEKKERKKQPIDVYGTLALMLLLLSFMYGFQTISDRGEISWLTGVCFFITLVTGWLFYKIEKKAADPIISMDLLSNSNFLIVNIVAALVSGFLMGMDVYMPMWTQGILGMKAAYGGLVLTPLSVTWVLGSFLAGRLLEKWHTKRVISIGLVIILIGAILLATASQTTSFAMFCIISAWTGIGLGIAVTSSTVKAQSSVAQEHMGVATSFNTLSRTLGQTVMISIFGVILNQKINQQIAQVDGLEVTREMVDKVANPAFISSLSENLLVVLRNILYNGLHYVYLSGTILLGLAIVLNLFLQKDKISENHSK